MTMNTPRSDWTTGSLRTTRRPYRVSRCFAPVGSQLCNERDLGAGERARHRTGRLRLLGEAFERCGIDALDLAGRVQLDPRDREARVGLLEMHTRGRGELLRRMSLGAQQIGQRHRVTGCVREADQLLGVRGVLAVLDSGAQ